jgi:glutamate--cysteine ligase
MPTHDAPPIQSTDELLAVFRDAEKPPSQFRIGPEMEKHGLVGSERRPFRFRGEGSVEELFRALNTQGRFRPIRESATSPLIGLEDGTDSITLEPGCQLEHSGGAEVEMHAVAESFKRHIADLTPYSQEHAIAWYGLGFHPYAKQADLEWVEKARYAIMKQYLPTRGARALDMMLRTATVQVNLDFANEADAMRKLRVSLKAAPIVGAMFANAPFLEGEATGHVSERLATWLAVDEARSGLVRNVWREGATYNDYVEWALDVPMFLVKRPGRVLANTGQTFRAFLADGFEGERANVDDWTMHINTLFPEVRLKKTLEVRCADAQGPREANALPALWVGLLYDDRALADLETLTSDWTFDEMAAVRAEAPRLGLRTPFRGHTIADEAKAIVRLATEGLERRDFRNASGRSEAKFLDGLAELVNDGMCPADRLLRVAFSDGLPAALDAHARLL